MLPTEIMRQHQHMMSGKANAAEIKEVLEAVKRRFNSIPPLKGISARGIVDIGGIDLASLGVSDRPAETTVMDMDTVRRVVSSLPVSDNAEADPQAQSLVGFLRQKSKMLA